MAIKRVSVRNFRSFRDLTVELTNFNVIIGSNASGKSNFIRVFEFLRDVQRHGLENAVSLQGGVEYLRNITVGSGQPLSIEVLVEIDREEMSFFGLSRDEKQLIGIRPRELLYRLSLSSKKRGLGFEISEELVRQKVDFLRLKVDKRGSHSLENPEPEGKGEIAASSVRGETSVSVTAEPGANVDLDQLRSVYILPSKPRPGSSFLQSRSFLFPEVFSDMAIFDFDTKLPKRAVEVSGKAELEEDGSNLAIVLDRIVNDRASLRKFSNLITDLLPYVVDLDVMRLADKSILFSMKEKFSGSKYLPASILSDGTINIAALIVALYFQQKGVTIIEEPERNIHPYLVGKIISMMRDAAERKQILVTTHNPEFVKHARLDSLLLVYRDGEGFTRISKPAEQASLKMFLSNEMGIEDLYIQNLLGP